MTIDEQIKQAARLAAPVFAAMGWTWWNTSPRTPSIREIEESYRELLQHIKKENDKCSSGRLMVRETDLGIEFLMELA